MSFRLALNTVGRFPILGKPLFWATVALFMMGITTIVTGSALEDHDQFCASCHMQPENTYDQRAQIVIHGSGGPVDLASQHYVQDARLPNQSFRCVDCHRGDHMLGDRSTTLLIGANDLVTYFVGVPNQQIEKGSVTSPQVIDNSCMTCHQDIALRVGFPNHFHNKLPAAYTAWRRGGKLRLPEGSPEKYQKDLEAGLSLIRINITCIDCHKGHVSKVNEAQAQYYDLKVDIYPICEKCHLSELGRILGLGQIDEP